MKAVGIVGGGQLGMMMIDEASKLNLNSIVLDPDPLCPCKRNATELVVGNYDDYDKLDRICKKVDCLTYEFENVSAGAISILEQYYNIPQGSNILYLSQNRIREKEFAKKCGFTTAKYAKINSNIDLEKACNKIGFPCILKTSSGGYDGKGQHLLKSKDDFINIDREYILEEKIDFDYEISSIASRSSNGSIVIYPLIRNEHINGILHRSKFLYDEGLQKKADKIMRKYLEKLEYVGTLCVELFVCKDEIIFNEMAPRPHNSGHLTIEACTANQFKNHILGIMGMDLVEPEIIHDCQMVNILGMDMEYISEISKEPNCVLHLYGKSEVRPSRKMGHCTFVDCEDSQVLEFINKYIRRTI